MKIKYKYRSNLISTIIFVELMVMVGLTTIAMMLKFSSNPYNKSPTKSELILSMLFLLTFVIFILSSVIFCKIKIPVEMIADSDELSVTMPFRETIISYSDIESISLDHEFKKAEIRGEDDFYNEILTITDINKKKYVYHKKIELDQNKVVKNPAYLEKQFEKSEFSRLKRYIEEQMKFEKRLRINLQNIHGDR
ncbi:hypothetical protein [uncultured Ruminococcus sp.]|uniref:hypothetical protein n=1 Tax=uncultured Ruminococcus sp. TaxID=165186 RepID=UPI0025D3D9E0|nr:hypothetical protein [uncultured Ruminococcus sp.]